METSVAVIQRENGDGQEDPYVLSPSQIDTWDDCKRKWAWRYVAKLRPPAAPSAALGVKTHHELEKYLKTGEMPDFVADSKVANIAASIIPLLPKPTPGLEVEKGFKFRSPATGIYYRGFIDLTVPPGISETGEPEIYDHKTTSDLVWAKTSAELQENVQAIIYAQAALMRWPDAMQVHLRWNYGQTRGANKSLPVRLTVLRSHVDRMFPLIEQEAKEIISTLQAKKQPLDLPPNARVCEKYGGCPFRDKCNLSPLETIQAMSNAANATESLLSRLSKIAAAPPPVAEPTPPPGLLAGLLVKPAAEEALPAWATAPEDPRYAGSPFPKSDQPINPPEYQPPPPPPNAETATATTTEAPKKAGRPKGSKNKPKEEAIVSPSADTPAESPVADTTPAESTDSPRHEAMRAAALGNSQGFTLYVDCFPVGRKASLASKIIAQAHDEVKAAKNVYDYRSVGYGEGAGMLSQRVAELAATGEHGDIVLDSRTPEGNVCLEALRTKAAFVVQGLSR